MSLTTFGEKLELRSEVEVDVEPARVWLTLIDFARHDQWNPFWSNIKGQAQKGSRVSYGLTPPGGSTLRVSRRVDDCENEQLLRWSGGYGWGVLLRSEQTFRLNQVNEHRTRVIVAENLRGPGVTGAQSVSVHIARGQALMNQALKRRVETAR